VESRRVWYEEKDAARTSERIVGDFSQRREKKISSEDAFDEERRLSRNSKGAPASKTRAEKPGAGPCSIPG
jgi:hypothetical protein